MVDGVWDSGDPPMVELEKYLLELYDMWKPFGKNGDFKLLSAGRHSLRASASAQLERDDLDGFIKWFASKFAPLPEA